jgi:hypothetical protein
MQLAQLLCLSLGVAAVGGMACPKSSAFIHASCQTVATASASCSTVRAEVLARVAGQYGQWHDPHNNGTYTVLDESAQDTLQLKRLTGDGKYTDKVTLTLANASDTACTVSGCSESQVTSVLDYSTNYCNIRMLTCGSADGCKPVNSDWALTETSVSPSKGAGKDPSACLKVLAAA